MQHFWDTVDTIPAGMGFSYFHPFHLCWLGGIALAIFALCRLYRRSDAGPGGSASGAASPFSPWRTSSSRTQGS